MYPATLSPELLPEGLDDLGLSTPSFDGVAPPDSFGLCKLMNLGIALVQMNSRKRQEVVFCSLLWELGVVKNKNFGVKDSWVQVPALSLGVVAWPNALFFILSCLASKMG